MVRYYSQPDLRYCAFISKPLQLRSLVYLKDAIYPIFRHKFLKKAFERVDESAEPAERNRHFPLY
jgi:hypothetical protein